MSVKKLLYVVSQAPYSNAAGQEAIDAILVGASFEQVVSVLFIHDGVFQIKSAQDTQGSELKQFTKAYRALNDFGIEQIYVHDLSMHARGLSGSELVIETQTLISSQVAELIADSDKVFTF